MSINLFPIMHLYALHYNDQLLYLQVATDIVGF